jgi:hypothetical protein
MKNLAKDLCFLLIMINIYIVSFSNHADLKDIKKQLNQEKQKQEQSIKDLKLNQLQVKEISKIRLAELKED